MQRNRPSRTCAPSGLQGHGAQRLVPNLAGRFHHPFELALLLVDIDAVPTMSQAKPHCGLMASCPALQSP